MKQASKQAAPVAKSVARSVARSLGRPPCLPRILLLCQGRRSFYLSSSFLRWSVAWLVCRESENRLGPSASLSQVKCVECFLFLTTPSPPISLSGCPYPLCFLSRLFCCTPRQLAVVFGRSQASPSRREGSAFSSSGVPQQACPHPPLMAQALVCPSPSSGMSSAVPVASAGAPHQSPRLGL